MGWCKHIFINSAFSNCFARRSFRCGRNAGLLWNRGLARCTSKCGVNWGLIVPVLNICDLASVPFWGSRKENPLLFSPQLWSASFSGAVSERELLPFNPPLPLQWLPPRLPRGVQKHTAVALLELSQPKIFWAQREEPRSRMRNQGAACPTDGSGCEPFFLSFAWRARALPVVWDCAGSKAKLLELLAPFTSKRKN